MYILYIVPMFVAHEGIAGHHLDVVTGRSFAGGSISEVLDWQLARGNRVEGATRAHEPGQYSRLPLKMCTKIEWNAPQFLVIFNWENDCHPLKMFLKGESE